MMTFQNFIEITGGTTTKLIDNVINAHNTPVFFQPFRSKTDIALRATSIVTAPIVSVGFVVLAPCASLLFACKALLYLAINPNDAKEDILAAGGFLMATALAVVAAVTSALINLIDFLGSFIRTLQQKCGTKRSPNGSNGDTVYVTKARTNYDSAYDHTFYSTNEPSDDAETCYQSYAKSIKPTHDETIDTEVLTLSLGAP